MQRGETGRYQTRSFNGERVRAFIPAPLPPDPPLALDGDILLLLERAHVALGRLDGIARLLPQTDLFLYAYVRREAALSSQIEGTQSSFSDLVMYESGGAPGVPEDDVADVSRYVQAMDRGLQRLAEGFPLSNRLVREIHGVLLAAGRGSTLNPGEFRTSQNWIGGTRPGNAAYVPPPPAEVPDCMGDLERYLHAQEDGPALVRAGLAHAQFETVHPFLDGNGRVGRLLIPLLLCHAGVLREPLLYLSLYLKQHRSVYYDLLNDVRRTGDWEAWLAFFLEGVAETAGAAVEMARRLTELLDRDAARIEALGRRALSARRAHQALAEHPIRSVAQVAERAELTTPTATAALLALEEIGLVHEATGRRRGRLFAYTAYVDILNEGTEPL